MNTGQFLKLGVLLVAMLMLFTGTTFATKYYVNIQTGLDTKDGLTPGNAKHSIGNAIAAAAPGDTISVDWANGNPYLENITVDKVLTFARTDSDPSSISVTSWHVNIVAHVGANRCTFTGKFLFPDGLTITDGQIYGANILTVQTSLVRHGTDLDAALASRHSTVVDGQIIFNGEVDITYVTHDYAMMTGGDLPETGNNRIHDLTTTGAGNVTLNQGKWMNGLLNTGSGVFAIGSANTLQINAQGTHNLGGNVTGGTIHFIMNGAVVLNGNVNLPNITTTGSNTLTINDNNNSSSIASITAGGETSITVPFYVGSGPSASLRIGAVTNNSSGNITLSLTQWIASLSNTSTGHIAMDVTGLVTVGGSISQSGDNKVSSYIQFLGPVSAGVVSNANSGYINFTRPLTALSLTQTGSGFLQLQDTVTVSGNVANTVSLAVNGNDSLSGDWLGVIRFSGDNPISIGGSVTNTATYTGTPSVWTDWERTGEIYFGNQTQTLSITGSVNVAANNSAMTYGGAAGPTMVGNGSITISNTTGAVVIRGGINNTSNWKDVGNLTAAADLNGSVIITALTTGTLGIEGTRIGAVSNTSATTASSLALDGGNGHILLGGVSTAVTFYGTSVSSSGGHGGQVLVANITVNLSSNVVNSRTVAGQHIQFGSAPTAGATVTIGGTIQNTTGCASTTTFPVFQGDGAENFIIGAIDCSAGEILVIGPCAGTGTFQIQTITINGGTVTLGSGAGSLMHVVVSGNTNFIGGTFIMATGAGVDTRTLELLGYTHKFSSAGGRTDFMANINCQILVQRTASFVAPQTLTGDLTETIWPGSLVIENSTGILGVPAVIFSGGNFRFLRDVTFAQGLVNMNGSHIFIGGQEPGPPGAGNFTNTAGYTTTGDGFITINGNSPQTVTGTGDFGNFEVDAVGPVAVQGKFLAIFGLTHGEVTGGTSVEFNNPSPYPTIRRNDGTFDGEPLFTSMVNVIYIGVDKFSALELPTATDKLWNLTVSTTNGLQAGGEGKGTVQVQGVTTYVNGKLNIYPGQALCIIGVDLWMKGDSIILNGDISGYGSDDELQLARPTGTIIKGAGALPSVHVDAGSVGNVIDGSIGIVQNLLGLDAWRGGSTDNLPGSSGLLSVGVYDADTAQITVKFGTPNSTTKAHIGYFGGDTGNPGLIVTNHGRLDLAADVTVKGIIQQGTININTYTLTDRCWFSIFSSTSVTIGSGVLRIEPEGPFGLVLSPPSVKAPINGEIEAYKKYADLVPPKPYEIPASAGKSIIDLISKHSQKNQIQTATDAPPFYTAMLCGTDGPVTIGTNVTLGMEPSGVPGILVQTSLLGVPPPDPIKLNGAPIEGSGDFTITKNVQLDSITLWMIDMDLVLTVTGSSVYMADISAFLTNDVFISGNKVVPSASLLPPPPGLGMLRLNPSTPPLTFTCYGLPFIKNLWVSNNVILAGYGLVVANFLHDGGELDYSADDFTISEYGMFFGPLAQGTYTRRDGASYKTDNTWFIFAGETFDQDSTNVNIKNLWFEGDGPISMTNTGTVTVSNKLKLETGAIPIDINNDVVPAGTRLAVAQLDTVVYVGGEFDVQPIYTAPITLITELTTTRTIHETVWPASALLVDTLIINNDIKEVVSIKAPAANKSAALALPWVSTSLMPGNRQINKCLDLRSGILGLDGSTVTLVDSLVIRRRETASVDLQGGAFAFGMTNVVYEPTAASPAGDIETGPELNSTVNNLTITRIGTPGNAMTYLDKNLTVNGTLRVANNFNAGDWTLTLNGHMIVTAPQLTFDGTLIFGGALPIQTVQLNGTLSPTNVEMRKTVIGTVNVNGGNINIGGGGKILTALATAKVGKIESGLLTLVNGILNIAPPYAVILNKPEGGGQGFDHTGVVYGAALSHVRGKVQQLVPAGAGVPGEDGRFEYPVGSWERYRPLAFTFTPNYPAINTTNIVVMDVDTIPEGTKDMPINGGYGVKIRNYPHYFWLVNATPSSFTQTQQFDVELHGMDLIYPDVLKDELRIIRRQDGSALINGWSMQGDSTTYTANYVYRPDPINYPNDSVVVVRSSSTYGAIVLAGTRFAIGIPARNPEFLASMPDTSVAQVDSISYTYRAQSNNIDGSITSYQLVSPPAGATITTSGNPLQAVVKYKPGYATTPGVHAITVAAFDGTLSKQTTSNVTVIKSNRSPVFTSELAVDTVVERTALSFTYAATDPDGDVVTYTMPDTTFGARLTGTVLSWTPTFAQAGRAYIVKVIASDGLLADTATKSVFVKHSRSKGDVNGTGTVSTLDATLILQFVVGIEPGKSALLDPAAAWAADVTGDGTVSALDAAYILQYLAHKRTLPTTPNILAKPVIASGTLGWGNLVAGDAGTMTLPMKVTGASNIYSVQFKANIGALKVSDLKANLPKDWMISWYSADGKLMVAAAGVSPINDGTIATICFQVEKDQKPEKIEAEVQMNESTTQALSAQVAALPTQFALENNYPNPFNPTTTIKYQLPEDVRVSVTVYNIQGQVVRTLVNEDQKAGYYTIQWDGRSEAGMTVATGIYIYRIDAGTFVTAKKMVMMK